jgi:indole-3-glycerol phosphate synthase
LNFLDEIIKAKKGEVIKLHFKYSKKDFEDSPFFQNISLSLINGINCDKNISIIAEIKKASPSRGIIRQDFNHLDIAITYFENDVNGISVLTDKKYFQGNITYLKEIAEIKSKPILRKDFIIDEHQILEAKANGADVILLIAEALAKNQIRDLTIAARDIGVEVLLELHSEKQLDKIDFDLNKLIGINNRNLETFFTNIETTEKLSSLLPDHITLVSESGINSKANLQRLKKAKVDAVLVGEFLMMTNNINENIIKLKDWCKIEN